MEIIDITEKEYKDIYRMIELWNIMFIVKKNRLVPKEIEFFTYNVYLAYIGVDISSARAVQFLSEKMAGTTGKSVVYTYRDKLKRKEWLIADKYGIELPPLFNLKKIPTLRQLLVYIQDQIV